MDRAKKLPLEMNGPIHGQHIIHVGAKRSRSVQMRCTGIATPTWSNQQ